jgi:hypothetical protein
VFPVRWPALDATCEGAARKNPPARTNRGEAQWASISTVLPLGTDSDSNWLMGNKKGRRFCSVALLRVSGLQWKPFLSIIIAPGRHGARSVPAISDTSATAPDPLEKARLISVGKPSAFAQRGRSAPSNEISTTSYGRNDPSGPSIPQQ